MNDICLSLIDICLVGFGLNGLLCINLKSMCLGYRLVCHLFLIVIFFFQSCILINPFILCHPLHNGLGSFDFCLKVKYIFIINRYFFLATMQLFRKKMHLDRRMEWIYSMKYFIVTERNKLCHIL